MTAIIAICTVLAIGGCAPNGPNVPGPQEQWRLPACVVVIFDPTVGRNTRDRYAADFARVVDSLQAGDSMLAGAISDSTEQTFRFLIDVTIPRFNMLKDSNIQYDARVASLRRQMKADAARLLNAQPPNSDILGGFLEAGKALSGERGGGYSRQIVIFFTDGIEQNRRRNFARRRELSGQRAGEAIGQERQLGRLPDLAGVRIYMAGIYSEPDPRADMTQEKMSDIRSFWATYAKATNAELNPADYGPSLVNFRLH